MTRSDPNHPVMAHGKGEPMLATGTTLGPYRILALLGAGGGYHPIARGGIERILAG